MIMCISSVKPVPWLAVHRHHLLSNGAAFNTPSRRSLTSYAISLSISQMNREFTDEMCITITFDISPSPNLDMFFMSFAHQDLLKVATVFTSNEEVTVDVMETHRVRPLVIHTYLCCWALPPSNYSVSILHRDLSTKRLIKSLMLF